MNLGRISQAFTLADEGQLSEAEYIANGFDIPNTVWACMIKAKVALKRDLVAEAENFFSYAKEKEKHVRDKTMQEFIGVHFGIIGAEINAVKGFQELAAESLEKMLANSTNKNYLKEIEFALKNLKIQGFKKEEKKETRKVDEFFKLFQNHFSVTPNTKWHVVSSVWFSNWLRYVGGNLSDLPFPFQLQPGSVNTFPGKVNNSDILCIKEEIKKVLEDPVHPYFSYLLKPGLVEAVDYVLVPTKAFEILKNSCGVEQDIVRYAIEQNDTIYQIEVYLKIIKVAFMLKNSLIVQNFSISRKNNISYIKKIVLKTFNLHSQSRAWKIDINKLPLNRLQVITSKSFEVFIDGTIIEEETVIDDAEIAEGNILLIEVPQNKKYIYTDNNNCLKGKCSFCQCSSKKVSCSTCRVKLYCTSDCEKLHKNEHKVSCKPRKKKFLSFLSCFCRQSATLSDSEDDNIVLPMQYKGKIMKRSVKFAGLQNLGNTCFMNSAVQCLTHTEALTSFFLSGEYSSKINKTNPLGTKGKIALAYAELLNMMRTGNEIAVAPWKLKKTIAQFAPQFLGHQQHDSHELLLFLISGLHEDLNQISKKPYFDSDIKETTDHEMAAESWKRHTLRNKSVIVDLMYGQYKSTLHCPRCKKYSYSFDPFNCLSLPIPQSVQKKIQIIFIPYPPSEISTIFTLVIESKTKISEIILKISQYFNREGLNIIPMQNKESAMTLISEDFAIVDIRGSSLFLYELPAEYSEFVIMNIIKEGAYSIECYPRLIGVNKLGTHSDFHRRIFDFFKPFFGRSANNETFASMLEQNIYKVTYDARRTNPCLLCVSKICEGCVISPDLTKITPFFKGKNYFPVNITFLRNGLRSVIDLSTLKNSVHSKNIQENPSSNISIYDCFKSFSLPEVLDKQNLWYCSTCKMHVQASKKFEIYKVPPILIIHLKRFKTHGFYREKLSVPINFPRKDLDLTEHVIGVQPPIYDLYAVSNHFGALAGGHYTASVCHESSEKWYNCNDSEVSESKEISEVSSYVLFYKARV